MNVKSRIAGTPWAAVAVALLGLVGLGGCTTMSLESSWKTPSYNPGPFKKILVIGASANLETRKAYEIELTNQLKQHGLEGVASYLAVAAPPPFDRGQFAKVIKDMGIDAVMITGLTKGVKKATDVAGAEEHASAGEIKSDLKDRYDPPAATAAPKPGDFAQVTLEMRMYDVSQKKLVWAARTAAFEPKDPERQVKELSQTIIRDLVEKKLIK